MRRVWSSSSFFASITSLVDSFANIEFQYVGNKEETYYMIRRMSCIKQTAHLLMGTIAYRASDVQEVSISVSYVIVVIIWLSSC